MQSKAKKLLCLILVLLMLVTALCGCMFFTEDMDKLNKQIILYVGDEPVLMSELISSYNNVYNMYNSYGYIQQGYITANDILNMVYDSIVNTNIVVNEYKKFADANGKTFNHEWVSELKNSKYLSPEEMEFVFMYVKYQVFTAMDSTTLTELKKQFTIGDAPSEDTTTRIKPVYEVIQSLSHKNAMPADIKNITEYLDKYTQDGSNPALYRDLSNYIFTSETNPVLVKLVNEINERITAEGAAKVTAADFIRAQRAAYAEIAVTIRMNNGTELEVYYKDLTENTIKSRITAIAAERIYFDNLEKDFTKLTSMLSTRYKVMLEQAQQQFAFSQDAYIKFIDELTSATDPFIYTVPQKYEKEYIFVLNLLVPFSDEQKKQITEQEEQYVTDYTAEYTDPETDVLDSEKLNAAVKAKTQEYRLRLAREIIAKDFLNGEEDVYDLFIYDESTNTIGVNPDSQLFRDLEAAHTADAFREIMYQYNTDVGQHDAIYPYAVRVGEYDSRYKPIWEENFVDAALEAYNKGFGQYAITATPYGVHIVFADKYIEAHEFNFTRENIYNTGTEEYRFFSIFYNSIADTMLSDQIGLIKEKGYTIKQTAALKSFLRKYNFTLVTED